MILNLPKLGLVRFSDDISPEELDTQVNLLAKQYDFKVPKRDVGIGTLLKEGFMRSLGETGIALGDVLPAMGASALGFEDYAERQMEEAATSRAELERKYPAQFKSYTEVGSPYEGLQYIAETLGELGPTALTAMIPGAGAGAIGTRLAGQGALRAAMAVGPVEAAAVAAAKQVGQVAGRRAMYGGVYLGSFAQNAPEVFEGIYRETDKMEPGIAALAGGLSSVLDTIVPGNVLNKFGGYGKLKIIEKMAKDSGAAPKVWKAIGKEAIKSAAAEGLTEAAQESINVTAEEIAGSLKGLSDPENIQRIKESFVKGAVGGSAFGTVGGVRRGLVERKDYRNAQEAEEALKAQMQAEAEAGTLTPEKKAEYDAAVAQARKKREEELTAAFADLPQWQHREAEGQAAEARFKQSQAYADLEAEVARAKEQQEKARAKQAQEQAKVDAQKAAQSAFTAAEVPASGLYTSETRVPEPVTPETLKALNIRSSSKLGASLLGVDLSIPEGLTQFVRTIEDPAATGLTNVNEDAYVDILNNAYAVGLGDAIDAARVQAKGAPDVTRPIKTPSGVGTEVSSQPAGGATTEAPAQVEPTGVDVVGAATEQLDGGAREQSASLRTPTSFAADIAAGKQLNTPEDVQFYQNNAAAIEEELKKLQGATSVPQTPETVQAETQRPQAPTVPSDADTVRQKLLRRGTKLDQQGTDAKAYFGKVSPEYALDAIANDLVFQPTPYRNAVMKLPSVSKPGEAGFRMEGVGPEARFGTPEEAAFFKGQGGVHAKNAEVWARANLSPEAVAYLDKKIAQYKKQKTKVGKQEEKQKKRDAAKKATKAQDIKESQEEEEYAPTREDLEEFRESRQGLRGERKKALVESLTDLSKTFSGADPYDDISDVVDTDLRGLLADPQTAALHTPAHPVILRQLDAGNLVGALQGLADSPSSALIGRIAARLVSKIGNTKVVTGAQRSSYDPTTNTINLRDDATEYEILHESTHAALSHVLDNPSHPVTKEITTLLNQLKADLNGAYGVKDVQEFAAEAWSNEEFRNRLREFRPNGQKLTGWKQLLNSVLRMLNLPFNFETAYDRLDRLMSDVISPPPETRTGETLYAQSLADPKANYAEKIFHTLDRHLQRIPTMTPSRATKVMTALEKVAVPSRKVVYKGLNASGLGEVASKYFGESSRNFSKLVNQMAGFQENLLETMHPAHVRFTKYRDAHPERQAMFHALINDSTIPDIRPYPDAETESRYRNTGKWNEYVALRNRFIKLTPEEQSLYRDYFAKFKALDKEFEISLKRNVEGLVEDKEKALSAYEKIMQELGSLRIDHYAPLYRDGVYWLNYELNGVPVREMLNTQTERSAKRKQIEAQGAKNIEEVSRIEEIDYRNVPDGSMLASILKIMKDAGAGEDDITKLIQTVVKALPEASLLKSRQKRTGIAGYINDNAAYVFDRATSNNARQLARMRYGPQIKQTIREMEKAQKSLRGDESEDAKELISEFTGRYQFAMNPTLSGFSQFMSSSAFFWNLAGNVSSALVNVLQTPMVVLPQLGGKYGWGESTAALDAARKLYTSSGFSRDVQELGGKTSRQRAMLSIENLVNKGELGKYKALITALKGHNLLQSSTARDAMHSENADGSGYGAANKLARVTTLVGSFLFHHAERFNREVTAVATYDLEMNRLKNSKMSEQERQDAAIREAIRMVEFTHGAGSTIAGPSLGQSDIGKVLMVFKRFAFSMYYMLFDTIRRSLPIPENATQEQKDAVRAARRQLVGVYGMAALFAGVKGVPLYWVAEMAFDMFRDDDEDKFDDLMREFLGEFLYKGPVNYITNLSIADRVGWTDLIFRENKGSREDQSMVTQYLEGILGAPYSIFKNLEKGFDQVAEGNMMRGIEAMLPAAIKNIMKGIRYGAEGANTLRGDPVMGDINGLNAAMQVLGFAPADLIKAYEENAYIKEREGVITKREKNLLKQYYTALREGDADRMNETRDKLFELGDKYPELGISQDTLNKSVAARDRTSMKMYLYDTQGIQINDKLRARLQGAASAIYD